MLADLITNALHSSVSAYIGVTAIFAYFALIVTVSIQRIQTNIKQDNHTHH